MIDLLFGGRRLVIIKINIVLISFSALILASNIVQGILEYISECDFENEEEPEDVDSLQSSEQGSNDDLSKSATEVWLVPAEVEVAFRQLCVYGPKNPEVVVVTKIYPCADEESEVWPGDW